MYMYNIFKGRLSLVIALKINGKNWFVAVQQLSLVKSTFKKGSPRSNVVVEKAISFYPQNLGLRSVY